MADTPHIILLELLSRIIAPSRRTDTDYPYESLGSMDRPQWLSLITLAERLEVEGLLFDAIQTLPQEQQPDREVMLRYTANVQSVERDNLLYRRQFLLSITHMEEHGLEPILMKGLSLSLLYPNPLRRPVGDVDLFVPLDQQHRYVQCLQSMQGEIQEGFDAKHLAARCNGLNWELHFHSIRFYRMSTDRRYHLLESEDTASESLCHLRMEGHILHVFPPLLNQIYLTAHFQHHLLVEQVTLRQVIDWMLALHHERTALGIGEVSLVRTLHQLGLYRLYRALGYICVQYLGLNADSYAALTKFSRSERHRGEFLLQIIIKGHVPGCLPYQPHLPSDGFMRRLHHYYQLCRRCLVLFPLIPSEAIAAPIGFLRFAWQRRKQHS